MAKDIKAIQCPHCGSVYNQELKPDFYKCQNCGTEYFLDSDDVHIYHHQERSTPPYSSAPPGNTKLPVYTLIGAVLFIVILYFVAIIFQPKRSNTYNTNSIYKRPRMYSESFVYTNTATGDPVYMRLGTDRIDKGNDKSEPELHAQFNNAVNGKPIADRIMNSEDHPEYGCTLTYKTYSQDMIYAIGCNILLQLDTKNNRLINVTQSIFKDYPQLSSGVAKLGFDYYKAMINVMNNEGNSYYYFPDKRQLVANEEQAENLWNKFDRHYFEFGYLGDYFDHNKFNQLIENDYSGKTGKTRQRDLTPGRKYFNPQVLYQDKTSLLIVVNTTAADNAPISIQRIDMQTGKIQWALPPNRYDLSSSVTKCKQGFAIEYRNDGGTDYIHGVLVVSDAGKLVYNYKLSRME